MDVAKWYETLNFKIQYFFTIHFLRKMKIFLKYHLVNLKQILKLIFTVFWKHQFFMLFLIKVTISVQINNPNQFIFLSNILRIHREGNMASKELLIQTFTSLLLKCNIFTEAFCLFIASAGGSNPVGHF